MKGALTKNVVAAVEVPQVRDPLTIPQGPLLEVRVNPDPSRD